MIAQAHVLDEVKPNLERAAMQLLQLAATEGAKPASRVIAGRVESLR